ncbi:hypothetical protein N9A28_09380 [Sulfurimonas sp.]|nr:hypothetical protein [Sulfurimonas sp.]
MISKFLETLYTKVFINIIVKATSSEVYVEICSKNGVESGDHSSFKTTSINSEMFEYINHYIKQSPFYYVSILDKSPSQGALPTCDSDEYSKYIQSTSIETVCKDKKWISYTERSEIKDLKYEYRSIGLDFIFSPFNILNDFFKDKTDSELAIFILVEDKYISLAVFNHTEMVYAELIDMHKEELEEDHELIDSTLDDDLLLEIDEVDLEDIEIDDDDSLEDFSDIEDLDTTEDIEEFAEVQEEEEAPVDKEEEESFDGMNEDYERFIMVQNSINNFYKDDRFESEFLESIYVADSVGVSSDLKKYFEEEMFLNVVVRKMDLLEEMSKMARDEL